MSMDKTCFGNFIARQRRQLGMTQRELAERLHVTDRAVSKWERGCSYPDVTLLEPLAAALEVSVEELLTGHQREPEALGAVQAVLAISGEEKKQRLVQRRRTALAAIAAALVLAVLLVMQSNGALITDYETVSPDGSISLRVYRTAIGNCFQVKANEPLYMEGVLCPYCGRGAGEWKTAQPLETRLHTLESLQWSADGRYLLLSGTTESRRQPAYLELWDFSAYRQGHPVSRQALDVDILLQLSGYSTPDAPTEPLLYGLSGVSEHSFVPDVALSDAVWIGGGHRLKLSYSYQDADGLGRSGTLVYDADTGRVALA